MNIKILLVLSVLIGLFPKYKGLEMSQGDDFLDLKYNEFKGKDIFYFQSEISNPKVEIEHQIESGDLSISILNADKEVIRVITVGRKKELNVIFLPIAKFSVKISSSGSINGSIKLQIVNNK